MKLRIIKILSIFFLALSLQLISVDTAQAQCPMCRMSAEQNLKDGGTAGKGLNKGILFLLMMPYVAVGVVGYVWYRNKKKESEIGAFNPQDN